MHALKTSGADVLPSTKKKKSSEKSSRRRGELGGDHQPQPLVRPRVEMHLNLPQQ